MQVEFVWDDKKNASNQKKHGVSFEEAKTCFEDDHARVFFDAEHSAQSVPVKRQERNFNIIGTLEKEIAYEEGI